MSKYYKEQEDVHVRQMCVTVVRVYLGMKTLADMLEFTKRVG
jgi:hypothetical protein